MPLIIDQRALFPIDSTKTMTAAVSSSPLFILYGSATGNAEHIAKDLAATYEALLQNPDAITYFPSVVCCELDQFKKKCMSIWEKEPTASTKYGVLIVTSTTGNGESPENASRFVRFVKRKTTVTSMPFKHCAFAVLALGDTNYDQFCQCGKEIDRKIDELGGTRAKPITCADEATGLEDVVEPWIQDILSDITNACHASDASSAPVKATNGAAAAKEPTVETPEAVTSAAESSPPTKKKPLGVATLRSLLGIDDASPIWAVDPKALPSISASRSCCELVEEKLDGTTKPRSDSLQDSFSTASSAGFHFNINRPFESTILKARYLTSTSTNAVEKVAKVLEAATPTEYFPYDAASLLQAADIVDQHFPLSPSDAALTDAERERNAKRVIELTLSLPDDYTLEYAPGDSLGVLVENTTDAVQFVLDMFREHHGILPAKKMSVDDDDPITVEQAVRKQFDLCSPIKNKRTLLSLSQFATDSEEACALQYLASKTPEGEKLFKTYVEEQTLTIVDILREFPSTQSVPMNGLLGMLSGIPPRYYSVSSSPIEHQRLSLTVAFSVVDYVTPSLLVNGEERGIRRVRGIATRYMEVIGSPLLLQKTSSSITPQVPKLKIFPKPTAEFRMPNALSTPLVLIGPGTGIAPFMGFLSHRRALAASSESATASQTVVEGTWRGGYEVDESVLSIHEKDASGLKAGADFRKQQGVGSVDLYFGCRHKDHDWLYRDEMDAFEKCGIVSNLCIAFSRDGKKEYVQDVMKSDKNAERLAKLILEETAAVYVCGDGNAMAKDVKEAIVVLLSSRLDGGVDEAKAYLETMKTDKRFLLDIWS
jgi:sulfite reductase alpha subunit-like flavoprotein